MQPSLVRHQLGGIVPPKVASPTLLTGGSGGSLTPLVNFYSKLPKGPAPQTSFGGLKAKFFSGKNASSAPVFATILGIFAIGYTIDYQSAYHVRSAVPILAHTAFVHTLYDLLFADRVSRYMQCI
ncbi:mitochondrial F1-F0 ATP synthase subunit F of fungi-domain-containing protein [Thelephora terrestris]|uniref:Mitochondrial F1-F0 ATP synthase subunit F of fungi-domain-containing protein n=1 Tax=Thelephora terrestris TaxID=56493 RepID=A0A9P6H3F8_9AGAM|nr:mitochondrial F1-F0 ATP synthase subunit F of fungi-domain-containing protein [Thelephora terrestris]